MEQGDWGVEEWLTEEEPVPEEASPRAAGATRDALVFANEVTARVVKVHLQDVRCDVLKIDGEQLFVPCRGTIRAADVMTLGIDRYDLLDCFRPGDLIRAKLVATGISKSYLLTTVPASCGVVHANSRCCRTGMEPVASNLMRCPACRKLEYRVVAASS